jgi:tRNA modification GTPase
LRLALIDTAGIRESADEVEVEGVSRARLARSTADLVVVVIDVSQPLDDIDFGLLRETEGARRLVVANKSDLPAVWRTSDLNLADPVTDVSSKTGAGLDALRQRVRTTLEGSDGPPARDTAAVTNLRHALLLDRAREALRRACASVELPGGPVPEEFVLTDLQDARNALEEVTGKRTSEDLLRHIFSRFCIGK